MDKDYRIRFESGGRTLELSPTSPCRLLAGGLRGFDSTGLDVAIRSYASLHGGHPERRRFTERELGMTFEIDAGEVETEELRRSIAAMMDPRLTCELDVEIYGVHRCISVIPCGEVRFERETMHDRPEVMLEFVSPDVFFRAAEPEEVVFRDPVPLLTYPLTFFAGAGMTSGIFRTSSVARPVNRGDTSCGIVAEIVADGGDVVTPGISCGDAFIKCPLTLSDGDRLVIDTRDRQKNIYLNGERHFMFDRRSTFFRLPMGESVVTLLCESGEEYVRARMEYVPLYFGV